MPRINCAYCETVDGRDVNYFVIEGAPYVYCGDAMAVIGLYDKNGNYGLNCRRRLRKDIDYIDYSFKNENRVRCYLTVLGVFNAYWTMTEKHQSCLDIEDALKLPQEIDIQKNMWHICNCMRSYSRTNEFPVMKKKSNPIPRKRKEDDLYTATLLEDILHEFKNLKRGMVQDNINRLTTSITLFESIISIANKNRELTRALKGSIKTMRQERDNLVNQLEGDSNGKSESEIE